MQVPGLGKRLNSEDSLCFQVFNSIAASDVMSMNLVKQCQFLKSKLGIEFTSKVLSQPELSLRNLKQHVIKAARMKTLEMSENHQSLQFALHIARENTWMKFWDVTLEHGLDSTRSSLSIVKLFCLTVFRDRNCHASNCPYIVPEPSPLCEHFLQCHTDLPIEITPDYLTNCIISTVTDSEQFLNIFNYHLVCWLFSFNCLCQTNILHANTRNWGEPELAPH